MNNLYDRVKKICENTDCLTCPIRDDLCKSKDFEEITDEELNIVLMALDNSVKEDPVNRPAHYTDGRIEVIDYIEDKKLGFCLGNAIKYISRAGKKDPTKEIEDLYKADWYIRRRIQELEDASNDNLVITSEDITKEV